MPTPYLQGASARHARFTETYSAMADGPYTQLSSSTPFDDDERQRTPSPPPPNHLPFAGRGGVASIDTPFEFSDSDSMSSQDDDAQRMNIAEQPLAPLGLLSSQKHPVVDCAFNVYRSQIQRASARYYLPIDHTSVTELAKWQSACSAVTPQMFYERQNPPLAGSPALAHTLVKQLLDIRVLTPIRPNAAVPSGVLQNYVSEASLQRSVVGRALDHPALQDETKRTMIAAALNMSRDAGKFEFFELVDIYGFKVRPHAKLDSKMDFTARSTRDACEMHNEGGQVSNTMIEKRRDLVAKRKTEVQGLLRAFKASKRHGNAHCFS